MGQNQKNDRIDLRLAGAGGQGLITSGFILAYAMGVWENPRRDIKT